MDATLANIRNQLRNSAQYIWAGYDDAASWCADNKVNLAEALVWAERSIQQEERFENLARAKAMEVGNAVQIYVYGRQLQTERHKPEAIAIYRTVAKRFPDHWLGHLAGARAHVADGDFAGAIKELQASQAQAPAQQKTSLETLMKRLDNREDING